MSTHNVWFFGELEKKNAVLSENDPPEQQLCPSVRLAPVSSD